MGKFNETFDNLQPEERSKVALAALDEACEAIADYLGSDCFVADIFGDDAEDCNGHCAAHLKCRFLEEALLELIKEPSDA